MAKIMQNMFRTTQNIFDFKGIPASNERYGIHQYPAMLHYMLVRSLLKKYDGVVYDPFCGSGVVITEAIKQNRKVYGTDINPLALLIAKVRSSNYDVDQLQNTFQQLKDNYNNLQPEIPAVKNLEYWFKPQVINDLGKIRTFITQITDDKIREFFLVVFSETVRKVSNNKSGEFKRFRLNDEKLKVYKPDALNTFVQLFKEYVEIVQKYKIPDGQFYLYLHDTRKPMPFDEKIDLVITSPPYGDSRTTVAYGQFSSFSLDWIKGLNPFGDADLSLDKESLGGKKVDYISLPSKNLNTVLEKIQSKTSVRAKEVYSFFYDLYLSFKQIVNILSEHATVCLVVGNRRVAGIEIPMDYITAELFTSLGLECTDILVREISNKRMPLLNSPTNIQGFKSSTMRREYIVVCRR